MRLRSEADVQEFLDAVSQCGGDVYLNSSGADGDDAGRRNIRS